MDFSLARGPQTMEDEGFAGIQPFYFITLFTLVHCL